MSFESLEYELVVGLEVHIQLNTKSKIFSSDFNRYGDEPNEHVNAITAGHPGTLPYFNRKVLQKAVALGLACNCKINERSWFDRKHYFYPDLPKGYQTTQENAPICKGGEVKIQDDRIIRLNRIHMEEDAGKSIHNANDHFSKIDLNRAGVPLLELVTEPDFRSGEEAAIFLKKLRKLVRHLEISDGNMEEGSLRCDANISLRSIGDPKYGTRVEIKNLNSFRNVKRAIQLESARQLAVLKEAGQIFQETRSYDAVSHQSFVLREKEAENDYRYFPDPDNQFIYISKEEIQTIRKRMPETTESKEASLVSKYHITNYAAKILVEDPIAEGLFMDSTKENNDFQVLANFIIGPLRQKGPDQSFLYQKILPQQLAGIVNLVVGKKISPIAAEKVLLPKSLEQPDIDINKLAEQLDLMIDSNLDIAKMVDEILEANPDKVKAYQKGKKNLVGFFVGQLMRDAKGKIDPKELNNILEKKLSEI